jgi:hypothetical protein
VFGSSNLGLTLAYQGVKLDLDICGRLAKQLQVRRQATPHTQSHERPLSIESPVAAVSRALPPRTSWPFRFHADGREAR